MMIRDLSLALFTSFTLAIASTTPAPWHASQIALAAEKAEPLDINTASADQPACEVVS
jgi:hypothetical protein